MRPRRVGSFAARPRPIGASPRGVGAWVRSPRGLGPWDRSPRGLGPWARRRAASARGLVAAGVSARGSCHERGTPHRTLRPPLRRRVAWARGPQSSDGTLSHHPLDHRAEAPAASSPPRGPRRRSGCCLSSRAGRVASAASRRVHNLGRRRHIACRPRLCMWGMQNLGRGPRRATPTEVVQVARSVPPTPVAPAVRPPGPPRPRPRATTPGLNEPGTARDG